MADEPEAKVPDPETNPQSPEAPAELVEALRAEIEGLKTTLAEREQAHAQRAAEMAAAGEALAAQLTEAQAQAQRGQTQLVEAHRGMVLARNPDLVPELVQGATLEEIDASVEVARAAYARIVEAQRAQAAAMVPAGASPRSEPAAEELSPLAKITSALTRNGRG